MPVFDRLELARNYLEQPSRPIEILSLCRGHSIAHFMIKNRAQALVAV